MNAIADTWPLVALAIAAFAFYTWSERDVQKTIKRLRLRLEEMQANRLREEAKWPPL